MTTTGDPSLPMRRADARRIRTLALAILAPTILALAVLHAAPRSRHLNDPARVLACSQRASVGSCRESATARSTRARGAGESAVQRLREINYYPSAGGWMYMWTHFNPSAISHDFDRIHRLGANAVRIFVQPPAFGFPTVNPVMARRLAEVIGLAAQHSLRVHLTLFDFWHEFANLSGSREWAASLLSPYRHNPHIAVVELKNEIDPTDAPAVAWVSRMLPYLRTILPRTLRTVSVANVSPQLFGVFTQELRHSPPDFWDYHFYGPPGDAYIRLSRLKLLAAPRPLFIGETGFSTGDSPVSASALEQEQASYYRAVFAAAKELGLPDPAPWTLNDFLPGAIPPGKTANNRAQYGYGLYQADGAAKPAAAVVKAEFSGS